MKFIYIIIISFYFVVLNGQTPDIIWSDAYNFNIDPVRFGSDNQFTYWATFHNDTVRFEKRNLKNELLL